jgi:1-acyl-sn-glycerol-3-phosphate acyltransferase
MIQATLKCIGLVLLLIIWFPLTWAAKKAGKLKLRDRCMMSCSACILWVMGTRVQVVGEAAKERPLLLISNHLTYMDIPVLSSFIPTRFTPKSEIGKWPIISSACDVTGCVYVERKADKIKETAARFEAALKQGEVLSLFPESTTSDGLHVLPFKSSFFSLATQSINGRELAVQPAAMTYIRVGNLPVDSTQWPKIAWIGDALLGPHFWEFLQLGNTDVSLTFLPPVTISQFGGDRKALASYCHKVISEAIETAKHAPVKRQSRWAMFRAIWKS